jgi:SAM-dependent methyltransferase
MPDANDNPDVYYDGCYWNNLDCTVRMINTKVSGREDVDWWRHFADRTGRTFERGLFLNCGNGWVERDMVSSGFVKEAVGIDYSDVLLQQARDAADQEGLPIRYQQLNINSDELPTDDFDLVVNHAAAHHIARLNRVFRKVCTLLPPDGWFISFDYVGPHRNQYPYDAWECAWQANNQLPPEARQVMRYPNIEAMLQIDPTEAVHSELIIEMLERYFSIDEKVYVGGAIAYPILTHNANLFAMDDPLERERLGQMVLDEDRRYLERNPDSSLFAYFTAQPNKSVLTSNEQLWRWRDEEEDRERAAEARGGEYYERSLIQELYLGNDSLTIQLDLVQQGTRGLQDQLTEIQGSFLYSHLTRLLARPGVQRALRNRLTRRLIRREP